MASMALRDAMLDEAIEIARAMDAGRRGDWARRDVAIAARACGRAALAEQLIGEIEDEIQRDMAWIGVSAAMARATYGNGDHLAKVQARRRHYDDVRRTLSAHQSDQTCAEVAQIAYLNGDRSEAAAFLENGSPDNRWCRGMAAVLRLRRGEPEESAQMSWR